VITRSISEPFQHVSLAAATHWYLKSIAQFTHGTVTLPSNSDDVPSIHPPGAMGPNSIGTLGLFNLL
jgi:hypothetical protein